MPQIVQLGALNTTALTVPDLIVQIVPPQNLIPQGVPSNVIGYVGTAIWGPVNQPVVLGTTADYVRNFGQIQARKYDMGTGVYIAAQQGANAFRCVRVSDGTDTAATVSIPTSALTITALYTGTLGNSIRVTFVAGSAAGTTAVLVQVPGFPGERFDNIPGSGNALWVNIAAALSRGLGSTRSASSWVVATAGAGTSAVTLGTPYALTGGSDGVTTINAAALVGADTLPRSGMYALRSQGCGIGVLADTDDSTQWVIQGQFGLSEAVYMMLVAAAGSAITNGSTGVVDLKATAGLDNYAAKLMHGDWIWWNDQVNKVQRLVSPQHFVAGLLGNMAPERSTLNKPLYGVVASQKSGAVGSGQSGQYASADLSVLFQAGIDVIANPAPGGSYWAVRRGCNTSSNPSVNGDNYTRLTDYIATTVASVFGQFVGRVITPTLFQQVKSALMAFLGNMASQGQISSPDGSTPYGVVCDISNNPQTRTSIGYLQADIQVVYGPIALFVVLNMEGGQTVTVARQVTAAGNTIVN